MTGVATGDSIHLAPRSSLAPPRPDFPGDLYLRWDLTASAHPCRAGGRPSSGRRLHRLRPGPTVRVGCPGRSHGISTPSPSKSHRSTESLHSPSVGRRTRRLAFLEATPAAHCYWKGALEAGGPKVVRAVPRRPRPPRRLGPSTATRGPLDRREGFDRLRLPVGALGHIVRSLQIRWHIGPPGDVRPGGRGYLLPEV